ncbi:MAG: thioredoxin family protein [Opitutales bacterium]|nr:thioredoxin family protein [Opitutales bacterium]
MKFLQRILILALLPALFGFSFSSEKPRAAGKKSAAWLLNYDEALAKAKAEDKPLIVLFTGSDWCIWCKKLDKATLSKPEFIDYADKNYVMVLCDFPQADKPSPGQMKKNQALLEKFGIEGFPTLVLVDAKTGKSAKFGYSSADTPEKFFGFVSEASKSLKKAE